MNEQPKSIQIRDVDWRQKEYLPLLPAVQEKQFGWLAFQPSPAQKELFQQVGISIEMAKTFRDTIAKGASVEELIMFGGVAKRYALDPFTGEIYFVKYAKKREIEIDGKRYHFYDYQNAQGAIVVGYKGYMAHARKQKDFCGIQGDLICVNDLFEVKWGVDDDGCPKIAALRHEYSAKDRGDLFAAWQCAIRVINGRRIPVYYLAYLDEHRRDTDPWKSDPSSQLKKCSISHVLRIAYGMTDTTPEEDIVKPETIGDSRADEYPESRKERDLARMNTAGTLEELQSIAEELNGWVMSSELRSEFGKAYSEKARYFKALPDKTGAIVMETHSTKKPEPEPVFVEREVKPETVAERSIELAQTEQGGISPEEHMLGILGANPDEKLGDGSPRYQISENVVWDQLDRKKHVFSDDGSYSTKGLPGRKVTHEAPGRVETKPEPRKEVKTEPKQEPAQAEIPVGPSKSKVSVFKMLSEAAEKISPGCVSQIYEDFGVGNIGDMDNDMLDAGIELLKNSIGNGEK